MTDSLGTHGYPANLPYECVMSFTGLLHHAPDTGHRVLVERTVCTDAATATVGEST